MNKSNVQIIKALLEAHPQGYRAKTIASKAGIRYFDAFPFVGSPWNSFLLEQYVATESKDFMLMHSSYAKNAATGAIVRRDSGFNSYDEVLADVLANAPIPLESDPCLEHLVKSGYIAKKSCQK